MKETVSAYSTTEPVADGDLLLDQEVYCPTLEDYGVADVSATSESTIFTCPLCHEDHENDVEAPG
jgi:hypothetical protein